MNKPRQQISDRQTRLISELDSLLLLANLATLVKAGWNTSFQNQPSFNLRPCSQIRLFRMADNLFEAPFMFIARVATLTVLELLSPN